MNHKQDYRDLTKWKEACKRQRSKYYGETAYNVNHKKRWKSEEIRLVILHNIPDKELSALIGRSVAAIQAKRCGRNHLIKD